MKKVFEVVRCEGNDTVACVAGGGRLRDNRYFARFRGMSPRHDVPSSDTVIRPAVTADSPRIAELLGELGYPTTSDSIPSRLAALAAERISTALVAERAGLVVGVITMHSFASIHDDKPIALITTLAVSQQVRKGGVGKALVHAGESWAHDRGCIRVSVAAALHRSDAHVFYERLGYARSGHRFTKVFS